MSAHPKVVVVGDVTVDTYLHGAVERLSPEAPIPVVRVDREEHRPGGAANVAANLAALGIDATLVTALGADPEGRRLAAGLEALGVEVRHYETEATTRKVRVLGGRQHVARLDFDAVLAPDPGRDAALLSLLPEDFRVAVVSDYGKGLCAPNLCAGILARAAEHGRPVIVDPKGTDWACYAGAALVTPNLAELSALLGRPLANEDAEVAAAADPVRRRFDFGALLVTRSDRGMTLLTDEGAEHHPTAAVEVFDVTGAGDTVVAAMAAGLVWDQPFAETVDLANRAARVVVAKAGTATASLAEIEAVRQGEKKVELADLLVELETWRRQGRRVVFTNGCFDLLHAGHVALLARARALGDWLIVAVNNDASVRRIKGAGRPLNSLAQRLAVLSALESVDRVLAFSEDTPESLLAAIRPDVLVKGADYRLEEVVGRRYAGRTELIPLEGEVSTTRLAARLAKAGDSG